MFSRPQTTLTRHAIAAIDNNFFKGFQIFGKHPCRGIVINICVYKTV